MNAYTRGGRNELQNCKGGKRNMKRLGLSILLTAFVASTSSFARSEPAVDTTALAQRASPGAGQKALAPLVGKWRVTKSMFWVGARQSGPSSQSDAHHDPVVNSTRHIYELRVTPPGKAEMLVDRMEFDRIK